MNEKLLSVGSVVLLKESTKRVMIMGLLQNQITEDGTVLWDYTGCLFPEGYMGPDKCFLFNHDQIERVYAIGYQDEEELAFMDKVVEIRENLHNQQSEE